MVEENMTQEVFFCWLGILCQLGIFQSGPSTLLRGQLSVARLVLLAGH
jgi:hypothetical protein